MIKIILLSTIFCFGQDIPAFDGSRAMDLLKKQCSFGPRYPNSDGHGKMKLLLNTFLYINCFGIMIAIIINHN